MSGGRIRSIKPELLEDAITAGMSDMAFRLFIAAIVLADDYGNLRFEPAWIRGQVYWARDVDTELFTASIAELDALITPYVVKGQRYGAIKNWSKHQKVDKPGKPKVPGLAESLPTLSRDPRETLATPSRDLRETLAPDLDMDQGSGSGSGSGSRIARVAENPPERVHPPEPPPSSLPDPQASPPEWFDGVLETVHMQTAVLLPKGEAWIRYAGHRASVGQRDGRPRPATREDAVYWLSSVMVRESRERREKARQQRDRDAKWDKDRERQRDAAGAPQPYHKPYKPPKEDRASPEETAAAMKKLTAGLFTGKTGS